MKCPITMAMLGSYSGNVVMRPRDCLKEECAWWDRVGEKCGVLSLTHNIHWLLVTSQQIRDKMSHEEQFRK